MRLRIFTEPQQGASYDTLLTVAKATEDLGFDAFFRSDHYLRMGPGSPLPGPTDAWITLAGLARETTRIRLGTLMSSATFRYPGPLAISVAQVDQMSGGRVELGLGAGWFAQEHAAQAIPFAETGERFGRFEEQLAIVTGLWAAPAGETFSFSGRYYTVTDSPGLPKPAQQPRPPVLIGGAGLVKTPRLAARYADEFNVPFAAPDVTATILDRVRAACTAAGRAPDSMTYSAALTVTAGRTDAQARERAAAIPRDPADLRATGLIGTPGEIADRIGEYGKLGVTTVYLQVLDLADLDHLELLAELIAQVS